VATRRFLELITVAGLSACTTIDIRDAYPTLFSDGGNQPLLRITAERLGLPPDTQFQNAPRQIVAALPDEYAIAHYTGHLICVMDDQAELLVPSNNDPSYFDYIRRVHLSSEFAATTRAARKQGLLEEIPQGYPFVQCFVPTLQTETFLDSEWFVDWERHLNDWQERELSINLLRANFLSDVQAISENAKLISELNRQIVLLDQQETTLKTRIAAARAPLQTILALDGGGGVSSPFDPKIPYRSENDPFNSGFEGHLARLPDLLKTPSNTSRYIDEELLKAINDFNAAISDPARNFPPDLAAQLIALGVGPIVLESAARTPWRQAALRAEKKKNPTGTPTANYLESEHMFGLAADASSSGKIWDVKDPKNQTPQRVRAWETVKEAYGKYGIDIPLGLGDANHLALSKYSLASGGFGRANGKRLAIMRSMEQRAIEVSLSQDATISGLNSATAELVREKQRLISEVDNRRKSIEQKTSNVQQLMHELAQAQADRARREEEARARREAEARARREAEERARRAQEARSRDRDGADRGPRERPERQPRESQAPREAAPREATPRETAPRERAPARDQQRDRGPTTGGRILG
jgi:hypothetical protein